MVHVWYIYIYLHEWLSFMVNVGKYSIYGASGIQRNIDFYLAMVKHSQTPMYQSLEKVQDRLPQKKNGHLYIPRTQMSHILEDFTHKMEGQPPKKDVMWVLGLYIYIYKSDL